MKMRCLLLIGILLPTAALAQDRSKETQPRAVDGKVMETCKADIRTFCQAANLKQECLVGHWAKISSDCQDALATPMKGGGD